MSSLMRRFSLRQILLASFSAAVLRFMLIGWCVSSLYGLLFAQLLHSLTFGACHAAAIAAVWLAGFPDVPVRVVRRYTRALRLGRAG